VTDMLGKKVENFYYTAGVFSIYFVKKDMKLSELN